MTPVLSVGGINPYWKFASVFKCFTDTVILDDFKTSLDKLSHYRIDMINNMPFGSDHAGVHDRWYTMSQRQRANTSSSERAVLASTEHVERSKANEIAATTDDNPVLVPPAVSIPGWLEHKDKGSITVSEHV